MTLAYPMGLPITVLAFVFLAAVALALFKPSEKVMWLGLVLLLAPLYAAGRYATWSGELNAQGIRVSEPLAIRNKGGQMAWSDVISARVSSGRRSSSGPDRLVLQGRGGQYLTIPIGDMGPDDAMRVAVEVQRRARLPEESGGGEYMRRSASRGLHAFRPALLELRENTPERIP